MGKRRRTHPGAGARPAVTRPEDRRGGDANAHYDVGEARRYTSQNDKVQAELTASALDLLVLQPVDASGPLLRAAVRKSTIQWLGPMEWTSLIRVLALLAL